MCRPGTPALLSTWSTGHRTGRSPTPTSTPVTRWWSRPWRSVSGPACAGRRDTAKPGYHLGVMATAQPGSPRLLPGAVLARRWRLGAKLGEGGMGEVYAADPLGGGPRVAIKMLRPEFVADRDVLLRFLEEARTSMRLVHPNIVR